MNERQLRNKFPHASKAFLAANEDRDSLPRAKPKPAVRDDAAGAMEGEKDDPARVPVCVRSFRSRLIDPDNLCPKYIIDCLRYAGIISDDTSKHIRLTVEQVLVEKGFERTEILIGGAETKEPRTFVQGSLLRFTPTKSSRRLHG